MSVRTATPYENKQEQWVAECVVRTVFWIHKLGNEGRLRFLRKSYETRDLGSEIITLLQPGKMHPPPPSG